MNRSNFYYDQEVTEGELDQVFDDVEDMEENKIIELDIWGVMDGLEVVEDSPVSLTVEVKAGHAHDELGRRIVVAANFDVDLTSYVPGTAGQSRYVHIYVVNSDTQSDYREDGHGTPLYYRNTEKYTFDVEAGAASATPSPPSIVANQVLLCEILLTYGQTQIFNAGIDQSWYSVAEVSRHKQLGGVIRRGKLLGDRERISFDPALDDTVITIGDGNTLDFLGADAIGEKVRCTQSVGSYGVNPGANQGFVYTAQTSPYGIIAITKYDDLPPATWKPDSGQATDPWSITANGWIIDTSNECVWKANWAFGSTGIGASLIVPITLPHGSRLTRVKVDLEVITVFPSVPENLRLNTGIRYRDKDGDSRSDYTTHNYSYSSGGIFSTPAHGHVEPLKTSDTPLIIDNSDKTYWAYLELECTSSTVSDNDWIKAKSGTTTYEIREASGVYSNP